MTTLVIALVFVLLLGLERWRGLRSVRIFAAVLALTVLFVAQPGYTRAARSALGMPSSERITHIRGDRLSEYASGVRTMEQAVADDAKMGSHARLLALGVLFWLACSPVLPRRSGTEQAHSADG